MCHALAEGAKTSMNRAKVRADLLLLTAGGPILFRCEGKQNGNVS
jgi:hypothetical protein